jgi:hypothetical protein
MNRSLNMIFTKMLIASCALASAGMTGCAAEGQLSFKDDNTKASFQTRESSDSGDTATRLSQKSFNKETCEGYNLEPEHRTLSIADLKKHLEQEGISYSVRTERDDLHLFDLELGETKARLRVATLKTQREAGRHLHQALLEHGQGYWGVHRSNLAVLGPTASTADALSFATTTGLACWGVLTTAGRDDSFVIPGAYFEL